MTEVTYPAAARSLLRDTLLDATGELLHERRWSDVTMVQIASGAGVSRQTLYNEFGDREGIAQAYVLREGERLLGAAERAIADRPGDPRAAIASAFEAFLSTVADHPLMTAARRPGGDELVPLVTTQGMPVLSFATERLAAFLVADWPRLEPADARTLSESVVRLAISHAALPTQAPRRTAASLARVLGPYVDEVFARGAAAEAA